MDFSPQQTEALDKVRRWLESAGRHDNQQIFRLFGYAGTGKTTLAIQIADMVRHCLFGSFTGKAALVMRKKGCHGAQTLHSLIYKPRREWREGDEKKEDDTPRWEINPESALRGSDLLIIDECSMVNEELARDVLSFGTPVLVLGDPAQLPPVSGAGFFTDATPDVMLTEVHRQAADNPIVRIATMIRTGEHLDYAIHKGPRDRTGVSIVRRDSIKPEFELMADQILCGKNDTRCTINRRIRGTLRTTGKLPAGDGNLPVVGDRVICLKNKRDRALLNGSIWQVKQILDRMPENQKIGRKDVSYLQIDDGEGWTNYCKTPHPFWFWNNKPADLQLPERMVRSHYDEFDYAYAITCHKSQGSQWDRVMIFDESQVFGRDGEEDIPQRWLYTALTRAAEAAIIVR